MLPKADHQGNDDDLDINKRLDEVATILAGGIIRLRSRAALPNAPDQKNLEKSSQDCLEVPGETVLSVKGVNGVRDLERRPT